MRVSREFLKDYVDIENISYQELADKMVFAGNEYESIEKISEATGLVVGYVKSCRKHPDSHKLSICEVDLGSGEAKQILCGAPNVREGIKVIVATIGAKLPGGIEIKKAKLAGMDSNGMICSLLELGIEPKYLSEEDKNGIHILPMDAEVGMDAIKYLGYDDEVIDFELTANRADLMSMLGMAYEVGAIYDKKVNLPDSDFHEGEEDIHNIMKLDVKTEACPIYLGKLVRNVTIKESPLFIKNRLMACGIRPINNVVDISNYVMLEYGQPLHFFDADKLGTHVVVRNANDDEVIKTLDGIERTLMHDDIVIANEKDVVALAGVMGGYDTEVTEDTKNIFIESAIFAPLSIRYTAKRVLRSEASSRYEKGIDPNRVEEALKRATHLLEKYASGLPTKGILSHDVINKSEKHICISKKHICSVLGIPLTMEDICDVLRRLGFIYQVNGEEIEVTVPTRRLDVSIKEDIIEEVGRIYGYEHMVGILPHTMIKKGSYTNKAKFAKEVKQRLSAMGLQEVITYSLVSKEEASMFHQGKKESTILLDPMSEDRKYMRHSLIPSLLHVLEYNKARNQKDIAIYEVGSIYGGAPDYLEERTVSGLVSGSYLDYAWQGKKLSYDFYFLKGVVESLLSYLGYHGRYEFSMEAIPKELHPGRSTAIMIDRDVVGYLGQVHPSVIKSEVYVFELNLEKIMQKKVRGIKAKEQSKYPAVNKDVAFIVSKDITSAQIQNVIRKSGGRLLTDIDVFDVYEGENVGENKKSIAYSLTFQDITKTLSDEEVNTLFYKIIADVEKKVGAKLRDK